MKAFKHGVIIFLMGISLKVSAVCFNTVEDYKKVHSEFPPEFQNFPIYITTDGRLGVAAIEVREAGEKYKIDANFRKGYTIDRDDAYIESLCFENGKIKINYEKNKNGKKEKDNFTVTYNGTAKTLSTFLTTFQIVDKVGYDRVADKIAMTLAERNNDKLQGGQGAR